MGFDAHYDGRFADKTYPPETRNQHLRALLRTYLATMHSLGAETWIMHGSLLGWWWNRRIMPWDSDIDVQVSEPVLSYLASYYNMSVHSFKDAEWLSGVDMGGLNVVKREDGGNEEKRQYLLDINPHWKNGSYADNHNVIDARWIDMKTGLYIDITTVRWNRSSPVPGTLYCKDRHHYLSRQIFPLRTSEFEGVPVKIPYAYQELLAEEYGTESLVQRVYRKKGHWFDHERMEWVKMNQNARGKLRQDDKDEEQRETVKKTAAGKKRPNAKNDARDEEKDVHLKPREGRKVQHLRRSGDNVFDVVLGLFVGG
ncbi:mannosyltransferase [Didymosphaeria variabile]|uniref:Mannosyltransferase n=1 Tax=Didymosphaeria variabile TaxID=1932322 RepID=A0A9W9CA68_9PLEO|nr:mannosyltransferase [Didymosphaeria variabile]KAJ4352028.1 mannosyltransferase [Didymosphaeria variabile]